MSVIKHGARWHARLRRADGSAAVRKACEAWRAERGEHDRTFRHITEIAAACDQLQDDPDILALRQQVLTRSFRKPALDRQRYMAVAACLALICAMGLVYLNLGPGPAVSEAPKSADAGQAMELELAGTDRDMFETSTGQRSTVSLADGSTVIMNTGTRIRTRYTANCRTVELIEGQAIFDVASDPDRPFDVVSDGRVVRATGTEFEVRTEEGRFSVTLIEGAVAVQPRATKNGADTSFEPSERRVNLVPGQRFELVRGQAPVISELDIENAVSWREGRLEFRNERLGTAIRELNRYSELQLVLQDPTLADLRIGGSFKTNSMANFVAALEALYPVDAKTDLQDDTIVLSWQ